MTSNLLLRLAACFALVTAAACSTDNEPATQPAADSSGVADSAATTDAQSADTSSATGDAAAVDTSTPTDAAGASDSVGTVDTAVADAGSAGGAYDEIHKELVVKYGCNGGYCHGSGAGGLTMSDKDLDASYNNLMKGQAAGLFKDKCTHKKYVVPGKPSESLLWLKIDANAVHGCGKKMPSGTSSNGVPAGVSKMVSDWIAGGAKR